MSSPTPNNPNSYLRLVMERDRLNKTNFDGWYRNLRIALKAEKKLYVLEKPIPEEPPLAPRGHYITWLKHNDDSIEVTSLMLACMIPSLQRDFEYHNAYDMITQLKEMFQQLARSERFETVRALHACKMEEGEGVSGHVLKMKSHLDHLERLGNPYPLVLATDLILNSLPRSYDTFILNYKMNSKEYSISELHSMLKTAEQNIPKPSSDILIIDEEGDKEQNYNYTNSNEKGKLVATMKKKEKVAANDSCFECGELGHWKKDCQWNCPTFLAELEMKRSDACTSGNIEEDGN